ncbi:hypothetical protein CSOJ01_14112 [Colletotrichum sojae]|uniref:Uncharacterized protein n=1 Tax=Colletotrichum sojae TaxID=2175907 RepID=A0A8H6MKC3_9PEZI|nr:hypothetical protein CSOJ01_14112 [Colletotrichum sojae]
MSPTRPLQEPGSSEYKKKLRSSSVATSSVLPLRRSKRLLSETGSSKHKKKLKPSSVGPSRRPRPVQPPLSSKASVRLLSTHLSHWVEKLPATMIGTLGGKGGNDLVMPKNSSDGRRLTWEEWVREITRKVTNSPKTADDCWFIRGFASLAVGYPVKKVSKDGNKNRWPVHQMTFFLKNPERITDGADKGIHAPTDVTEAGSMLRRAFLVYASTLIT